MKLLCYLNESRELSQPKNSSKEGRLNSLISLEKSLEWDKYLILTKRYCDLHVEWLKWKCPPLVVLFIDGLTLEEGETAVRYISVGALTLTVTPVTALPAKLGVQDWNISTCWKAVEWSYKVCSDEVISKLEFRVYHLAFIQFSVSIVHPQYRSWLFCFFNNTETRPSVIDIFSYFVDESHYEVNKEKPRQFCWSGDLSDVREKKRGVIRSSG